VLKLDKRIGDGIDRKTYTRIRVRDGMWEERGVVKEAR